MIIPITNTDRKLAMQCVIKFQFNEYVTRFEKSGHDFIYIQALLHIFSPLTSLGKTHHKIKMSTKER